MAEDASNSDIDFVHHSNDTLTRMIERFRAAFDAHKGGHHIDNLRNDMKAFLASHIDIEHYMMASHNYPLIKSHMDDHVDFKARFLAILAEADTPETARACADRLLDLHDDHVRLYDNILCQFLLDRYVLHQVHDGLGI